MNTWEMVFSPNGYTPKNIYLCKSIRDRLRGQCFYMNNYTRFTEENFFFCDIVALMQPWFNWPYRSLCRPPHTFVPLDLWDRDTRSPCGRSRRYHTSERRDSDLSHRNKIKVMSLNDNIPYKESRDFRDICNWRSLYLYTGMP